MVNALEYQGVCLEEEIENRVSYGEVHAGEENDGFEHNHVQRAHEGHGGHLFGTLFLEFDGCENIRIASFFAQASCSSSQDLWTVGFGKEDEEDQ